MESQTVDTLKKGDTQRNGQISSLLMNRAVDMQKKGMYLKCGHEKKAANPPKQTEAEGYRNIKVDIWAFQSSRASATMNHRLERMLMKEYTAKEMKLLKANPYTFKVTKNKLYFTVEFKETFWTAYQAGMAPRKILADLGYDLGIFGQKQIDSMVQSIKRQAQCGSGFRQGENRTRRKKDGLSMPDGTSPESKEALEGILNEVRYLRQEVEFLKKIVKTENTAARKS